MVRSRGAGRLGRGKGEEQREMEEERSSEKNVQISERTTLRKIQEK